MPSDPAACLPLRTLYLRAATAADAPVIRRMVHAARINPLGLHWEKFVVVENALDARGTVVGIGQVKQHGDGSRELASLAVRPDLQRTGVGSAVIHTLQERECGPLYLICREELTGYYARRGFRTVTAGLPPYLRRMRRIGRAVARVAGALGRATREPAVMVWPGSGEPALTQSAGQSQWGSPGQE